MKQPILDEVLQSPLSDLPNVVVELLDVCARRDASLAEVAEVIERAPGIALRLLRFANSAEIGRAAGPTTLLDAAAIAGLDLCRIMALGEAFSSRVSGHNQVTLAVRSRCLLTAAAARALSRDQGRRVADQALLAGLLALVGELAAAECRPQAVAQLLRQRHSFHPDTVREAIGLSGPELGGHLLRQWRIPSSIVEAVEGREDHAGLGPPMADTLRRAVSLAELLGSGCSPTDAELSELGLDTDGLDAVLTDVADLIPTLAPITGEAEHHLFRTVGATRAAILTRALNLEHDRPGNDVDVVTGLPSRTATANYAAALERFASQATAFNSDAPEVGALVFRLIGTAELAEEHDLSALDAARSVVVSVLRDNVRSSEFLGTVADNEFVIIAPATSRPELDGAVARFARLCNGLTISVEQETIPIAVKVSSILHDVDAFIRDLAGLRHG